MGADLYTRLPMALGAFSMRLWFWKGFRPKEPDGKRKECKGEHACMLLEEFLRVASTVPQNPARPGISHRLSKSVTLLGLFNTVIFNFP